MKNKKAEQSMKKYSKLMGFIGLIGGVGMILLFAAPFYSTNYGGIFDGQFTGFDYLFDFDWSIDILISLSFISLLMAIVLSGVQMKFEKVNWITAIFFLISAFDSIFCTLGYYAHTLSVGAILVFVLGLIFGLLDAIPFLVSFFKHLGD